MHLSLYYWNQSQHFPAKLWQRENLLSVPHWISFVFLVEGNLENYLETVFMPSFMHPDCKHVKRVFSKCRSFSTNADQFRLMPIKSRGLQIQSTSKSPDPLPTIFWQVIEVNALMSYSPDLESVAYWWDLISDQGLIEAEWEVFDLHHHRSLIFRHRS